MDNPTTIALSRMVAQTRAMDVTATNIANSGTPGFRAARMVFSDWLMKSGAGGTKIAYTQDRATYRDTARGQITATANPLDLSIGADGYFTVETKQGPRLTRSGHFELSATGAIVDSEGNALLDSAGRPMQVAGADTQISIAADGTISSENGQIGRVGVVTPTDPNKLRAE
ncbi:MAG TPA: flagellar hook basal-body protein, partial [Acetobacteraceae bacterium]